MARHSKFERARRVAEGEQSRRIAEAWSSSLPPGVASDFAQGVAVAHARGPLPPPPDMAPGTAPRPPRPGREPKVVDERPSRRRSA